jgi:hypothetical protein
MKVSSPEEQEGYNQSNFTVSVEQFQSHRDNSVSSADLSRRVLAACCLLRSASTYCNKLHATTEPFLRSCHATGQEISLPSLKTKPLEDEACLNNI